MVKVNTPDAQEDGKTLPPLEQTEIVPARRRKTLKMGRYAGSRGEAGGYGGEHLPHPAMGKCSLPEVVAIDDRRQCIFSERAPGFSDKGLR